MKEPYAQIGGVRRGWVNLSWPFANISVNTDRICISVGPINRTSIEKLTIHNGIFSTGLRIWRRGNSEKLIFWSRDIVELKKALVELNYKIDS